MRSPIGLLIFFSFIVLLELYVFQSVKYLSADNSSRNKTILNIVYWSLTAYTILSFLMIFSGMQIFPKVVKIYIFSIAVGLMIAKICGSLFFLVDDIRRLIQWITMTLFTQKSQLTSGDADAAINISRSAFLSWVGLGFGSGIFGVLLYGFGNKYRYQLVKQRIKFDNLPAAFKGLKIIHISDIHSGSFTDIKAVELGIQKILEHEADLILFTGDLVNDMASEMDEYKKLFSTLKAPMGVYSVLGNHDYGDYVQWPKNGVTKEQNLENLKKVHHEMGWRLLLNEHVVIERDNESIAILGIENWGAKARFPKYGRLDLAHAGTEKHPFKILMSHDPSHWKAQVRNDYKDIDLMLSGHTHGMQFGVELPGIKWSPIKYLYQEWAGLYEHEGKKLYVNRGFGFLGYPGRVGILPEITLLELV
jgi:predicted MPP superfamily phosphohydrolase